MSEIYFEYARVIGEKLRAARQERRMSLRELAEKASMSASMLSQIETGKAYPSVRSIYNIAAALGLPVDYFFPEQDGVTAQPEPDSGATHQLTASEVRETRINRSGNPEKLTAPETPMAQVLHASARPTIQLKGGVTWARLTAFAEPDAEFLEITYVPGASSGANMSHHEGWEFGLILEGELFVELGFELYTLRCGDSIIFDSTRPHRLSNRSDKPIRALWVVWNCG